MKNLKKLSVVLFAIVLSFSFNSCLDDGVSDAVDQVYLAQAEYLRARAALRNAEAMHELANATYRNAEAASEAARKAHQEALTAEVLEEIAGDAESNAYDAARNVQLLAEYQAKLEVVLKQELLKLWQAITAHEVAMVQLGDAVAQAKDDLLLALYQDYSQTTYDLNRLQEDRLAMQADLWLKELLLWDTDNVEVDPWDTDNVEVDPITWEYYQMMLEADLASLESSLAAKQASLAAMQAITAEDASDTQKMVTVLEAQIADLHQQKWDLGIDSTETKNAVDQAWEAWEAAQVDLYELNEAEGLLNAAKAALKAHTDAIEDAEEAIEKANDNIASIPAKEAALAAVDTTTAWQAIQDQIALIGEMQEEDGGGENDYVTDSPEAYGYFYDDWSGSSGPGPHSDGGDFELLATGGTLWDAKWNAEVAGANAEDAFNCATLMIEPDGWGIMGARPIQNLEFVYAARVNTLNLWVPGTPIVDLEATLAAALLEEEAASEAFLADPAGFLITDGADGDPTTQVNDFDNLGIHTDNTEIDGNKTYMRVATWVETFPNSMVWRPGSFHPEKYQIHDLVAIDGLATIVAALSLLDGTIVDAGGAFPAGEYDYSFGDDSFVIWEQDGDYETFGGGSSGTRFDADDAELELLVQTGTNEDITMQTFVDVEDDDTDISNFIRLQNARIAATTAQFFLDAELTAGADLAEAVAHALANLTAGYACLGYDIDVDINGTLGLADYDVAQDYVATLLEAWEDATEAFVDACDDLDAGILDLGVDFRPGDTDDYEWTNEWTEWWALLGGSDPDLVDDYDLFGPGLGEYQQLEGPVNAALDMERMYIAPHEDPTLYEALRNAYFERVWAMEAIDACGYVTYDSYNEGDDFMDTNDEVIEQAEEDIADLEELLPSHEYALENLQAEFDAILAAFGFDPALWDMEDDLVNHGEGVLGYLPLYDAWLDAMSAHEAVMDQIMALGVIIEDITAIRDTYVNHMTDMDITEFNVAEFMAQLGLDIEQCLEDIAALELDIENAEVFVAQGINEREDMVAWIAECQRRLEVLDIKIDGFETAAANLLARIQAILNS